MSGWALALSIIAVVLAAASLGWQVVQHFLTGPRLRVRLEKQWYGAPKPDGVPVLTAVIINTGRQAATVTAAFLRDPAGTYCQETFAPAAFPHTIEAHSSAAVHFEIARVRDFFATRAPEPVRVRAGFGLATGRVLHSDWLDLEKPGSD